MNVLLREKYFVPGSINLLGGGPYSGKTTLLRTLLKASFEGQSFFGMETIPLPSWCHVVSDRDQQVFLADCEALGIPLPPTAHLWESVSDAKRKQHGMNFKLNGHSYARVWLRDQLELWSQSGELKEGGLVTLDTAMPFVPDARSYADSWLAAQELRDMARKYKVVLLLICHAGKYKHMQSAATPWERIQVSMALIGCTDTTLYICSPLETRQTKFDGVNPEEGAQLITLKGRQADSHYWTGKIKYQSGTTLMERLDEVGKEQLDQDKGWGGKRPGSGRPRKISDEMILDVVENTMPLEDLVQVLINTYGVVKLTARNAVMTAVNTGLLVRSGEYVSAA